MNASSPDYESKVLFVSTVLAAIGIGAIICGVLSLPIAREKLSAAERVAPVGYSTPIIDSSHGDMISNYRTQDIRLNAENSFDLYRPAPNLWVMGLEDLKNGASVHFLVDPTSHIIYEATAEGKTLLAYADTKAKLNGPARGRMLVGVRAFMAKFWCQPEGDKARVVHVDDNGVESDMLLDVNGLSALSQIAAMANESLLNTARQQRSRIEVSIHPVLQAVSATPYTLGDGFVMELTEWTSVSHRFILSAEQAHALSSDFTRTV